MKQSTIALALLPLLFTPVTKARTPEMPVLGKPGCSGRYYCTRRCSPLNG
ncbi:hypothetical protein ACLB1O_17065 [Escherichia coli]